MRTVIEFFKSSAHNTLLLFIFSAFAIALITPHTVRMVSLLAAATSPIAQSTVVYLVPTSSTLHIGETSVIDIDVNPATAINAIGITLAFPHDTLEIIGISKSRSFLDLWTEDTVIREDMGQIHFSGGTTQLGGLARLATALTLTVRAKKPGPAELHFTQTDVYGSDGRGQTVAVESRPLILSVAVPSSPATSDQQKISAPENVTYTAPSLITMSILVIHLFGPYDPRYDINKDGVLNLADLSASFARVGPMGK